MEFVILAVAPNPFVDLWQMRDHSFDERLGKFAHARLGRAKFPEILHSFRCLAVLEVAPEMILDGCLPRDPTFPHTIYFPRSSDMTLAISTAARAASVPRLILSCRQRSRAWSSLSRQSTVLMTGTP